MSRLLSTGRRSVRNRQYYAVCVNRHRMGWVVLVDVDHKHITRIAFDVVMVRHFGRT